MEQLSDTPVLLIQKDPSFNGLVTTWKKSPKKEDFEESIQCILDMLRKHSLRKILNDTRQIDVLPIESQNYVAEKVAEFSQKHFTFKQANVLASDAFGKFSVQNFDRRLKAKHTGDQTNAMFESYQDAQHWLEHLEI